MLVQLTVSAGIIGAISSGFFISRYRSKNYRDYRTIYGRAPSVSRAACKRIALDGWMEGTLASCVPLGPHSGWLASNTDKLRYLQLSRQQL